MIKFGIMALHLNSENKYVNEIASRAASFGIECFRFIPSQINPVTMLVTGHRYDTERSRWNAAEFPIPDILYDRCFYGDDRHSKQCIPIVSWLKNNPDITFLGYGLPNKLEIYEVLASSPLAPYLPASKPVSLPEEVLNELKRHRKIILKPVNGSGGNGIYYLEVQKEGILAKTEKQGNQVNYLFSIKSKLSRWLESLLTKKKFLVQPYLQLTDDQDRPFDVRVLLQKDANGHWLERGRGIRTGKKDGILSNLSAGGVAAPFRAWVDKVDPSLKNFICEELDELLVKIPVVLEDSFMPLFELGVDIGITKDGAVWILDLNSKPGRKVILQSLPHLQEELFSAPLLYAKKIGSAVQKERKRYNEKTLSN
ncbi:YheC/YheD family endospore coat-associated protein [Bacillus canaveralius]|uniref:YheC/YheD family endospore coat-associated protein n=1 Tax=Bacillus canaveralius TaxID=1403243 RepID=UPI000F79DFE6|nr:YheC/YheD family protein [Bacillus canaveralius]RSK51552.1 YheC/YheD family protein [Bacillus canaveralius]